MHSIKEYFNNFPGVENGRYDGSLVVSFTEYTSKIQNIKESVSLRIHNDRFIRENLIPFFENLS